MIKNLKIFTSNCTDPYINIATEKHLFDSLNAETLVLYLWQNENTIVIGKNQNAYSECNISLIDKDKIHLARRISGGGAVYHDLGNLNYTFISDSNDYDVNSQLEIIIKACDSFGIKAEISGRNDLLASGGKFSGSAFYNSGGKSMHHGTLLINSDFEKMSKYLTPSDLKLKSKGVKSVRSRVINLSQLSSDITCKKMIEKLIETAENHFNLKADILSAPEFEKIESYYKYFSDINYRISTPIPFTLNLKDRFNWGCIEICLQIKSNIIESVKVYSDSLDWTIAATLETALIGLEFTKDSIYSELNNKLSSCIANDIVKLFDI